MKCRACEPLLSERLDGRLSEKLRDEVEVHLASCEACRAVARELDEAREAVRSLSASPVPGDIAAVVRARIDSTPAVETEILRLPIQRWGWIVAAAACVLFLAVPLYLGRTSGPDSYERGEALLADGKAQEAFQSFLDSPADRFSEAKLREIASGTQKTAGRSEIPLTPDVYRKAGDWRSRVSERHQPGLRITITLRSTPTTNAEAIAAFRRLENDFPARVGHEDGPNGAMILRYVLEQGGEGADPLAERIQELQKRFPGLLRGSGFFRIVPRD